VLVQVVSDELPDHFLSADLPRNVGRHYFAPESLGKTLGPVGWSVAGRVVHILVLEVLRPLFDAKWREQDELSYMLWIKASVGSHKISAKRVGREIKIRDIELLTPLLDCVHEKSISFCVCPAGEGCTAAGAHAYDVEGYDPKMLGKTF